MAAVQKIRVCHIASGDLWAGAEAQLFILFEYLREFSSMDLTAILFNHGILEEKLRNLGVPVIVIPENENNALKLFLKTRKVLKKNRFDIIHTHRYKENIIGALAARTAGIKSIVQTVHGLPEPFRGFNRLKSWFYHGIENLIAKFAVNKIIAVSENIERSLAEKYPADRIVTIHNGIDSSIQPDEKEIEKIKIDFHLGSGEFIIGTIGRLTPVKGYHNLIKAFALIADKLPHVKIMIVGNGPSKRDLERLTEKLHLSSRTLFTGFIPEPQNLICVMDIFTLTSLHEGIPIALLEAMSLGKPVVATGVGGIPEIIEDGKSGMLVPVNDVNRLAESYIKIFGDKELKKRLGENARIRILNHFSGKRTAQDVADTYLGLLGREPTGDLK